MKRSRFTEEQIVQALRQAEAGTPAVEVCRKLGITEQTFYRWRRKVAGMGVAELRRLRQVKEENRRLKQLVADLTLDKHMLREVLRTSRWGRPRNAPWCSSSGPASGSASAGRAGWPGCRARPAATAVWRGTNRTSGPAAGPGRGARPVRLPAPARPAAAGGVAGQPQAGPTALPRGGAGHPPQAQEEARLRPARAPAPCPTPAGALEH